MEEQKEPLPKEKKKRRVRLPIVILCCVLCFLIGAGAVLGSAAAVLGKDGMSMVETQALIRSQFVGDYDQHAAAQKVLGSMVSSLGDRWSYYLTQDEYQQVQDTRRNAYVGIGVTVTQEEDNGLLILTVSQGGPAAEAGITAGEIIRGVNGTAVTQENKDDCVNAIKGEEGSTVSLEVEGADKATRTVNVTRRAVQNVSASWKLLDGGVGLITIQNFYTGTAELMKQGVEELTGQGAKALVFDVRNNPGGYVTELTKMLDTLLPEGTIFISRSTSGKEDSYTSDAQCVSLPMAVLVNGDSYSAAEFFAAELHEKAGAVIAGTQTTGKGYSQMLFPLLNGDAVGLSTARYFTGSGVSLIGTGLTPDPTVALSEDQSALLRTGQLAPDQDPQLQAAVSALHLQ